MQPRPDHPEDGKLVLIIMDAVLQDEKARLQQLTEKLRSYVAYVLDESAKKGIAPADVRIYVVCPPENPPTPMMRYIRHVSPSGHAGQAIPVVFKDVPPRFPLKSQPVRGVAVTIIISPTGGIAGCRGAAGHT